MRKIFKKFLLAVTVVALAAWLPLGTSQPASALSSCPTDLLSGLTPNNGNYNDSDPVNVGVKFNVRGAPYVSGVKFYKGIDNTGTHVAHLYDVTASSELDSKAFSSETSSGWQTVSFDANVQVRDDHNYTVWVSMPNGHYAADGTLAGGSNYFGPFGHGAYGDSESVVTIPGGNSGVYSYTSDDTALPSNATSNNYWVSPVVGDSTQPGVNSGYSHSQSAGRVISWSTTGKDTNSATSTGAAMRTSLSRQQGEIFQFLGYQAGNQSSITDPTAAGGAGYTYTVQNIDACGNGHSNTTFSTAGTSSGGTTIFGSTTPSTLDSGQTDPVTLGMRFHSDVAGQVDSIRIFRDEDSGPTGTTPITVGLWNTSGDLLASRSLLPGNDQDGWVNVWLTSPVSVDANTDYIAGYFTPNGQEMYTSHTFDNDVTNGDLTAPAAGMDAGNGTYSTNSTMSFPSSASSNNLWYGIDVIFQED